MNLASEFERFLKLTDGDAQAAAYLAAAECERQPDDLLSVADVAALLHVSDDRVRDFIRRGQLRAFDLNKGSTRPHHIVKRAAVFEFLETLAVELPRRARRLDDTDAGDWA
jgi:hypothetical protein